MAIKHSTKMVPPTNKWNLTNCFPYTELKNSPQLGNYSILVYLCKAFHNNHKKKGAHPYITVKTK